MKHDYRKQALASYKNALDTMKDAIVLYDNKRYARAYALMVISGEELTKSLACKNVSAGINKPDDLFVKEKGTTILRMHESKQRLLLNGLIVFHLIKDNKDIVRKSLRGETVSKEQFNRDKQRMIEQMIDQLETRKQQALYVDFDNPIPSQRITEGMCKEFLDLLKPVIKAVGTMIMVISDDAYVRNIRSIPQTRIKQAIA